MRLSIVLAAAALGLAGCSGNNSTDGGANVTAPAGSVKAVSAPSGDWTQTVSKTAEGYVMGNPQAKLKLVEYGSRLCPTCGAFAHDGYQPLIDGYIKTGKASLEFRDYLVHGPPDLPPALLGRCGDETTFFPLLEGMYADQPKFLANEEKVLPQLQQQLQSQTPLQAVTTMAEEFGYLDWIKQHGFPEAKARQCLGDQKMIDQLTKLTQDKTNSGEVTSTPTFFLNGEKLGDVLSWQQLEARLHAAGA